jgi:hypothetical protein
MVLSLSSFVTVDMNCQGSFPLWRIILYRAIGCGDSLKLQDSAAVNYCLESFTL